LTSRIPTFPAGSTVEPVNAEPLAAGAAEAPDAGAAEAPDAGVLEAAGVAALVLLAGDELLLDPHAESAVIAISAAIAVDMRFMNLSWLWSACDHVRVVRG
jgi:hypothetical protein